MSSGEAFEGAEDIRRAWARGLAPDPALDRVGVGRPAPDAVVAGGVRGGALPDRPHALHARRSWTRCRRRIPAQRVVFMKSAQVGATEAGNNWIGFCMHRAPGPFLAVQPTVDLAKRLSQQRIEPLIEDSPDLRELVHAERGRATAATRCSASASRAGS